MVVNTLLTAITSCAQRQPGDFKFYSWGLFFLMICVGCIEIIFVCIFHGVIMFIHNFAQTLAWTMTSKVYLRLVARRTMNKLLSIKNNGLLGSKHETTTDYAVVCK